MGSREQPALAIKMTDSAPTACASCGAAVPCEIPWCIPSPDAALLTLLRSLPDPPGKSSPKGGFCEGDAGGIEVTEVAGCTATLIKARPPWLPTVCLACLPLGLVIPRFWSSTSIVLIGTNTAAIGELWWDTETLFGAPV